MFTGIVQATCVVVESIVEDGLTKLCVDLQSLQDRPVLGSSIAINGCCLTVTDVDDCAVVAFDVVSETARITNLGQLNIGDRVNVERSCKVGDEIGGHLVSGHVACQAKVVELIRHGMTAVMVLHVVPSDWMKYLMLKGFVALNGASLTIAEVNRQASSISVNLIPETLDRTSFGSTRVGDAVNLEVDSQTQAVVETTLQVLADQQRGEIRIS